MSASYEHAQAKAYAQGHDGTHGSVDMTRDMWPAPDKRRKCHCGCGGRTTHVGGGGGLALTSGCELSVRRWVRDGYAEPSTDQQQDRSDR